METEFEKHFKLITGVVFTELRTLQEDTNMEDVYFADAVSKAVASSIQGSVSLMEVLKRNEIADREQKIRETHSVKDLLIKDQQEIGEKLKNGGVSFTYTYYISTDEEVIDGTKSIGDVKTKTLVNGTAKSIYEAQKELVDKQIIKVDADKLLVDTQKTNLNTQVKHNCLIHSIDASEQYTMALGQAGLIPSADMHKNFFIQSKALMLEAGITFDTSGNAMYGNTTLGTYTIEPTAPKVIKPTTSTITTT